MALALANATAFIGTDYLGLPPVSGGTIAGPGNRANTGRRAAVDDRSEPLNAA